MLEAKKSQTQAELIPCEINYFTYQIIKPLNYLNGFRYVVHTKPNI